MASSDLNSWLVEIGLEKYSDVLHENDVDLGVLARDVAVVREQDVAALAAHDDPVAADRERPGDEGSGRGEVIREIYFTVGEDGGRGIVTGGFYGQYCR